MLLGLRGSSGEMERSLASYVARQNDVVATHGLRPDVRGDPCVMGHDEDEPSRHGAGRGVRELCGDVKQVREHEAGALGNGRHAPAESPSGLPRSPCPRFPPQHSGSCRCGRHGRTRFGPWSLRSGLRRSRLRASGPRGLGRSRRSRLGRPGGQGRASCCRRTQRNFQYGLGGYVGRPLAPSGQRSWSDCIEGRGIDRLLRASDLVMKIAAAADPTDPLASCDALAFLHKGLAELCVDRGEVIVVADRDDVSVTRNLSDEAHGSGNCGNHERCGPAGQIDSPVVGPRRGTERTHDVSRNRPRHYRLGFPGKTRLGPGTHQTGTSREKSRQEKKKMKPTGPLRATHRGAI